MVTPTTIPLLLGGIHLPGPSHTAIRIATADAILETVTKGMPPSDKLALLTVLDLGTVLSQLIDVGRTPGVQATAEIELLREKLAKVLNGVGAELCKITEEVRLNPLAPQDTTDLSTRHSLRRKRKRLLSRLRPPFSRCSSVSSQTRRTTLPLPCSLLPAQSSPCTRRRRSVRSELKPREQA